MSEADLDVSSMKVAELKRELKSRGFTTSGHKSELVERLQLALMSENADEESDLLADANALLGTDDATVSTTPSYDELSSTTPKASNVPSSPNMKRKTKPATTSTNEQPKKMVDGEEEHQHKKKVFINRDVALPPVANPIQDAKVVDTAAKKVEILEDASDVATIGRKVKITPPNANVSKTTSTKEDVTLANNDGTIKLTDVEKAKVRAERFGLPLSMEAQKMARAARFNLPKSNKIGDSPVVDLETLRKRAARFGQSTSEIMQKLEMEEKVKMRQKRFGEDVTMDVTTKKAKVKALMVDEKMKKRAERFGITA